jgi:hypothetical protein
MLMHFGVRGVRFDETYAVALAVPTIGLVAYVLSLLLRH